MRKGLGVIGGLGPLATAYFYELLISMADARIDQEHPDVLIYSHPEIPDRTGFILGKGTADPVPELIKAGNLLVSAGFTTIAIPCVTAFAFYDRFVGEIPAKILHPIDETARYLSARGVKTAGIMATDGTLKSGIFAARLAEYGIASVFPNTDGQEKVMSVIYNNVKAGKPVDLTDFGYAAGQLRARGAEVVILGCTELSIAKRSCDLGGRYIDVLDVLSKASLEVCGYPVKEKYRELITP